MLDPSSRRYRHVLIDADNTLLDFTACERAIIADLCATYRFAPVTHDGRSVLSVYREINHELWRALERGAITGDALRVERFGRLLPHLRFEPAGDAPPSTPRGERPTAAALNTAFLSRLAQCGRTVTGAHEALRAIAPVVVVTNGFPEVQRPRLERAELMPWIERVFVSEEIGASKPSLDFFRHVFTALGDTDPRGYVIIGDSLSSDIAGGAAAGIDTIWFDPEGHPAPTTAGAPTYRIATLAALPPLVMGDSATGRLQGAVAEPLSRLP